MATDGSMTTDGGLDLSAAVLEKLCDVDSFESVEQVISQKITPISYAERFGGKSRQEILDSRESSCTSSMSISASGSRKSGSTLTHTDKDDASVNEDLEQGDWADGLPSTTGSSGTKSSLPPSENGETRNGSKSSKGNRFDGRWTKADMVELPAEASFMVEQLVAELLREGPLLLGTLGARLGDFWRRELRQAGGLKLFLKARPHLFYVHEDATKETVFNADAVPLDLQPPARTKRRKTVELPAVVLALSVEASGVRLAVDKLLVIKTCLAFLNIDHQILEIESRVYRLRAWPLDVEAEESAVAHEESRMLSSFYEFYTDVCLRHPRFHLVCTNPVVDVPLVDYALSSIIGKPPLSLRPGAGPLESPAVAVDFTAFVCGILSMPPSAQWTASAGAQQFIRRHGTYLRRKGLDSEPGYTISEVPQVAGTRLLAWQYLRCLSVLRLTAESAQKRLEDKAEFRRKHLPARQRGVAR